jgi:ribosomal protein S17
MGTEQKRGIRKSQVGRVTSTAMHKTVTVAVGDRVRIVETRPLSARKRWRVEKVIFSATSVD